MNIILTCVGRRNYLVKYFKEACGEGGKVVGVDCDVTAPALRDCSVALEVSEINSPGYIEEILRICQLHGIKMLVSLNDLELPIIASNKEKFEAIGVTVIVSNLETIKMCFDKYSSFEWLKANSFKTPHTVLDIVEAKKALNNGDLHFPLIVKPRWGSASTCVFTVESVEEMELAYGLTQHQLTRNLLKSVSQDDVQNIVIQQKMMGGEYGIDVLNDLRGENRQVLVKQKIAMRAGETDKACLIRHQVLEALGKRIGERTAHIGNMDCDAFLVDGEPYVLELNPRFGGGYPYSHLAGANFPRAIVEWVSGSTDTILSQPFEYGVVYAKSENLSRMDRNHVENRTAKELSLKDEASVEAC